MAFGDQTQRILGGKKLIYMLYCWTARQLEEYAKLNAPWSDRTSHARQSLHGGVDTDGSQFVLYLSQRVDYGIWLELAHAGTMLL